MELSALSGVLLFLADGGKSGYDIRLLFKATPLGIFSDSPGAIYPALARLQARGLLTSRASPGGRKRRSYFRTAAGDAALDVWLVSPLDQELVAKRPHELELRYVLIAMRHGRAAGSDFLYTMATAFEAHIADLQAFHAGHPEIGAISSEVLALGIRLFRMRLDWCLETANKGAEP